MDAVGTNVRIDSRGRQVLRVLPRLLGQQRLLPPQQVRVELVQLALLLPIVMLPAVIHVQHAVVVRRDLGVVHLDRPLLRAQNLSLDEHKHLLLPFSRELGHQTSLPLFELGPALLPARRRHHGDDDALGVRTESRTKRYTHDVVAHATDPDGCIPI